MSLKREGEIKPGVIAHTSNSSAREAEGRGLTEFKGSQGHRRPKGNEHIS